MAGSDTFTSANALATNGSFTSESIAFAVLQACKQLNLRLEPARRKLDNPTWERVVRQAYDDGRSRPVRSSNYEYYVINVRSRKPSEVLNISSASYFTLKSTRS